MTIATADNLLRTEAAERAEVIKNVHYEVSLDLTGARTDVFDSETRVVFDCAAPGTTTFIDLAAEAIDEAVLNGARLPGDAFDGSRVRLTDLAVSNELLLRARCRYQRTGVGLHRFEDPVDGQVYLHTQFEPFDAHAVYACFDQPDLKAPFQLTVRAPVSWTVLSNEPVVEQAPDDDDATRWRFGRTAPLPSYITAVVAGPLHAVTDDAGPVPLGLYCRASLAEYLEPEEFFEITRAGMAFFAETFGQPFPFRKYDQVFCPEFNWGAMENAGCVTFSENYIFRSRVTDAARMSRATTILHELAHMWFGDLVTMRWWDDLWLNESFATYAASWALAERTRFTDGWVQFVNQEVSWALEQDQLPTTHPIVADVPDTQAVHTNFDGITYAKGASVLSQLASWVGRDSFVAGLHDYFNRHAWGNAELADFLVALEKSSSRTLGRWAHQWLETSGVNTLRVEGSVDGEGRYRDAALVQQVAEGEGMSEMLRDQRVGLGLYDVTTTGLKRRRLVELDVTGARTPVPQLEGTPRPDLLLVNDGLLTFAKVRLDERSLDTLGEHLSGLADPLTRAISWVIAWDLLRDAELPARRYVDLVARHAPAETDPDLLRTLLRGAVVAADRYGDPANAEATGARLAERAQTELDKAAPGGDLQLLWARMRIATGSSDEHHAWIRGLLDASTNVHGLKVDHDLRWYAIEHLAARGAIADDVIAAEERRDATDMGARRAVLARASRPEADAKADAWRLALDGERPLAYRRAAMTGFHRYRQQDLLAVYADRYLEVLPAIWDARPLQESLDLTDGLFPRAVIDQHTVAVAEEALTLDAVPPAGRRLIREQLDETQRALRTREADRAKT